MNEKNNKIQILIIGLFEPDQLTDSDRCRTRSQNFDCIILTLLTMVLVCLVKKVQNIIDRTSFQKDSNLGQNVGRGSAIFLDFCYRDRGKCQ